MNIDPNLGVIVNDVERLRRQRETFLKMTTQQKEMLLLLCCTYGHLECATELLDWGVNADAVAADGSSAVDIARSYGYIELSDLLLAHGGRERVAPSDPGYVAESGALDESKFLNLVASNQVAQVQSALKARPELARVSLSKGRLETPLHIAALQGHYEMTNVLLREDIDVNAETWDDNTPLDLATSKGQWSVADLIRGAGGRSCR